MKPLVYLSFITLLYSGKYLAQDYHFSQFDANPFYVNPALTGERLGDQKGIQINADYRDQTGQNKIHPGAYNNGAVGIDEPLSPKFSLGQYIFNDQGAKGGFNTFGFVLAGAHKIIDQSSENKSSHNLSVGLQLGFSNKSIFPQNFTYDSQYSSNSPDGFDRTVSSGESYARQSYFNFNANFGVYYRVTSKNKKLSGFCGFAIYNISKPNQSFYGNGAYSSLPLRFNLHGGGVYMASEQLKIVSQFLYMNQGNARELNVNLLLYSKIDGTSCEPIYGIGARNMDAIIFHAGIKIGGITVRASYDVVIDYTKTYGNQGFEFTLLNTFRKKKSSHEKKPVALPLAEPNNKP